ncbi:hypothetical protein K466DRAFT_570507 [Polyporus arcularius HHB13444]|uniref:Uncharacterized protein n=1 Tax=Polyporus arcularius HHB13444 TaxID=1314778 RepID=A0A5C3NQH6_9APHY|nr:hypothetical protein K466DRAFT_570507 [Polyporus arcularius HHB13444]
MFHISCSIYPVDIVSWGPGDDYARKDVRLSVVDSSVGSVALCITGDAHVKAIALDFNRMEAFMDCKRMKSDHMVLFRHHQAGLYLTFADPDAAESFIKDAAELFPKDSTSPLSTPFGNPPSLTVLQSLGIFGEEDITSSYEHSFIEDEQVISLGFLFGDDDVGAAGSQRASEGASTLNNTPLSSNMGKSDSESWLDDLESFDVCSSESEDEDDDIPETFYDAVEVPECAWITLNA